MILYAAAAFGARHARLAAHNLSRSLGLSVSLPLALALARAYCGAHKLHTHNLYCTLDRTWKHSPHTALHVLYCTVLLHCLFSLNPQAWMLGEALSHARTLAPTPVSTRVNTCASSRQRLLYCTVLYCARANANASARANAFLFIQDRPISKTCRPLLAAAPAQPARRARASLLLLLLCCPSWPRPPSQPRRCRRLRSPS